MWGSLSRHDDAHNKSNDEYCHAGRCDSLSIWRRHVIQISIAFKRLGCRRNMYVFDGDAALSCVELTNGFLVFFAASLI